MNDKNKKRISKFLSLILRHNPDKIGLTLDENGWADVNELITKANKRNIKFSKETLEDIVETNDKKRFAFNDDKTKNKSKPRSLYNNNRFKIGYLRTTSVFISWNRR
jgi:putative RNA 2'-phosphotransferase